MDSMFNKLAKQEEDKVRRKLINFFNLYIENEIELTSEAEKILNNLIQYDNPNSPPFPSREVNEAYGKALSTFYKKSFKIPEPSKKEAKDLLEKLQKGKNDL